MVHADESLMAEDDRAAGAGGGAQLPLEVAEHPEFSAERPEKRLRANNLKDDVVGPEEPWRDESFTSVRCGTGFHVCVA